MNREEGSMYFNLTDTEFQAVCEIAIAKDIPFGQALAMLIVEGLKAIKDDVLEEATQSNVTIA